MIQRKRVVDYEGRHWRFRITFGRFRFGIRPRHWWSGAAGFGFGLFTWIRRSHAG
jgi:hypothetical protein